MSTTLPRGNILKMFAVGVLFDPGEITGGASTIEHDITVPGVLPGDIVVCCNKPTHTAGVTVGGMRVKAKDLLSISWAHPAGGSVDPPAEVYIFLIARPENPLPGVFNA